jgi:hypothetical protein
VFMRKALLYCIHYFFLCCAPSIGWYVKIEKKSLNVPNVKLHTFNFFFQHFWLFYAFLERTTACTLHIKWFSWYLEPKWPQWPQQPQQPQWPQWPLQPNFTKKLTELDLSINPDTKMTYPGLLMWDGSSKIH